MGSEAQIVAPSRAAALRYAERLNSFGLRAYPVITAAPNDGPEFKVARELDQEQVVNAFVDPEGEPEVLVVVDHAAYWLRRAGGAGAVPGTGRCGNTGCSRLSPG